MVVMLDIFFARGIHQRENILSKFQIFLKNLLVNSDPDFSYLLK